MKTKTVTYTLPTYWASALINNDESGLEDSDIKQMNNWLERNKPGSCVEVSEDTDFRTFEGLGCDVAEYTFIKY